MSDASDYIVRPLSELATVEYGKSPNDVRDENGAYPVYGTGGQVGYANSYLFEGDSIIVARKGSLNKPAYVTDKYWVIDTAYSTQPKENIDAKWLYYSISNFNLESLNEATGVPSISRDFLYKTKFYCPDYPAQQKISKILTTIDQLIDKTQALIDKHTAIKQGMMTDLFTRGIDLTTGQLRPHIEQAPHLYKETELGWIPKEWNIKRFEDITDILTCGVAATPIYVDASQGIPFLSAQNVNNGKVKLTRYSHIPVSLHKQLTKYSKPQKGDILYSRVGAGFGEAAVVEFDWEFSVYVSLTLIRMKSGYDNYFYKYLLNTQQVKNKASIDVFQGGGVPNLNVKVVREFNLPVPIFDEQKLIAEQLLSIDKKTDKERVYLNKLIAQKNGLMQDLLTGRVAV